MYHREGRCYYPEPQPKNINHDIRMMLQNLSVPTVKHPGCASAVLRN
jgi:hypothetical protein